MVTEIIQTLFNFNVLMSCSMHIDINIDTYVVKFVLFNYLPGLDYMSIMQLKAITMTIENARPTRLVFPTYMSDVL